MHSQVASATHSENGFPNAQNHIKTPPNKDDNHKNEKEGAIGLPGESKSKFKLQPKKVWIKCVFLKIEDINTVAETFNALCFVQAKWREKALDGMKRNNSGYFLDPVTTQWREKYLDGEENDAHSTSINWKERWDPQLDIGNILGETKLQIWRDLEYNEAGECFVLEKRRVKGTFTEPMELKEFPFDVQDLSLLITSERKMNSIELLEDLEDLSSVVTQTFWDSEWSLKKFVHCVPRTPEEYDKGTCIMKPGLYFRCCVIRIPGFFVWNIMLLIFLVTSLSFVTFCVDRKKAANRIQLSLILLLAGGTFKFNASHNVPHISYLTLLDRYILSLMGFLFYVALYHGWISLMNEWQEETAKVVDRWAWVSFVGLYFLLHVIFLMSVLIRGRKRRKYVNKIEQDYLKRSNIIKMAHVKEFDHKTKKFGWRHRLFGRRRK